MIWKRRVLEPTVAVQPTGSLWCVKFGPFQRNVDPTHHILMTLGEIALMLRLDEVGDPMVGCALQYVGVTIDLLRTATLADSYTCLS